MTVDRFHLNRSSQTPDLRAKNERRAAIMRAAMKRVALKAALLPPTVQRRRRKESPAVWSKHCPRPSDWSER